MAAAKKKQEKTRLSQYTVTLESRDILFKDCQILGYRFPDQGKANCFHYGIMEANLDYFIYDGATTKVKVIIDKHADEAEYNAIAKEYGGERYIPSSYNDYE